MHIPISNLLSALSLENLRNIHTPTQNLSAQPETISLDSLLRHHLLILPKLLEIRIFWPGRVRQEIRELCDILETSVNEPAFQKCLDIVRFSTRG